MSQPHSIICSPLLPLDSILRMHHLSQNLHFKSTIMYVSCHVGNFLVINTSSLFLILIGSTSWGIEVMSPCCDNLLPPSPTSVLHFTFTFTCFSIDALSFICSVFLATTYGCAILGLPSSLIVMPGKIRLSSPSISNPSYMDHQIFVPLLFVW